MKINTNINPLSMAGAVIDPETGRVCAVAMDIARALDIAPSQVSAAKGRVYQDRYLDIQDVIDNRAKAKSVGRPRLAHAAKPGIIVTELTACLLAALAGTALAAGMLMASAKSAATGLREAVGYQEATVRTYEELGFSNAREIRAGWESQKLIAVSRIEALENLNTEGE